MRPPPSIANSSRFLSTHTPIPTYAPLETLSDPSIEEFQKQCFEPEHPAVLNLPALRALPARHNWFAPSSSSSSSSSFHLNYDYFEQHADTPVPLELSSTNNAQSADGSNGSQFKRFQAPLWTFVDWTRSSTTTTSTTTTAPFRLYLAQCQLTDLPSQLQTDIPTPEIVSKAGKGDIYDTNIWLGLPPTYTPLHQDPNPNLFVQLVGTKHVRLLPPDAGLKLFARVRSQLGRDAGRGAAVFRGDEMMQGRERELLERTVWMDDGSFYSSEVPGYEAVLNGGDALFIPKGWWHSIKGVGEGITASVNWWFR
ncbi:uncharacterized protein TRUGW13939_03444 [Talaromyces rugulosus]|uniref:JmjC domain-containing protein n=1 Tax=Talaromyces rugulosus TaxID=121627 RepID=A0A7H8QTL1_TALRU|nr:uncharacterized protein TRUGW13939_03444 [Talaromyces rugulosus]QKX56343.1 hypothetical protein TRUGW13939_03444 [Talaromyces rugulosus]